MRIAFLVNAIEAEEPRFTTTMLALAALGRGHEICYLTPGDFVLRPDDALAVRARVLPGAGYKKLETLHQALLGPEARAENIDVGDIDVLFLRNDPADDAADRPWAARAGITFGRLAVERGVLVVNDPEGLARAESKLYLQGFPEAVRPATLISRSIEEIRAFLAERREGIIVKPLLGSGGRNVFKIASAKEANLNQIFEAISGQGYLIAQSYIPAAAGGDIRLFLMNGAPLQRDGAFAAMRRVPAKGEIRSNMHAKGTAAKVRVTEEVLAVADRVRPKLVQDGLFLVGLDIVGDKILEINAFTPGGLWSISEMYETDFAGAVIEALERKAAIRAGYGGAIANRSLATL